MSLVVANNREIVEEFRNRLLEKHKINLNPVVCKIILQEMGMSLRSMIMSRIYDKIVIPKLGYFSINKKPPRNLHVNLPHLKQETKFLPERFELKFNPTETLRGFIEDY